MSIQNFEKRFQNIESSLGELFSSTKAGCPSRFSKCGLQNLVFEFRGTYFKGTLFLYKGRMSIQNFKEGFLNIESSLEKPFSYTKARCPSRFSKCGLQNLIFECHQKQPPKCTFRMCLSESAPRMYSPGRRFFIFQLKV